MQNSDSNKIDFTTSLLTRMKHLEAEAADYKKTLAHQISANEKLISEVEYLKSDIERLSQADSAEGNHGKRLSLLQELKLEREQNSRLQMKIYEMERFLADYGLVWVGSQSK